MAQIACDGCQLPFSESELWKVGGRTACGQCRSLFGGGGTPMSRDAAAPPVNPRDPAAQSAAAPVNPRDPAAIPVGFGDSPAKAARTAAKAPLMTVAKEYDERFYRHSGAIGFIGPVFMIAAGGASAAALGPVYGLLDAYNPFVFFNFIATLFLAFATGWATARGAKFGDVRSGGAAFAIGTAAGLAALYLSWAFYIKASVNAPLTFSPGVLFAAVGGVAKEGLWAIGPVHPSGGWLKSIWLVEGAIIAGGSGLIALGAIGASPYCERCKRWLDGPRVLGRHEPIPDAAAFKGAVEAGDFTPFAGLRPAGDPNLYTKIELHSCDRCQGVHTLSVYEVQVTKDKHGNESEDEQQWIELMLVNTEVRDWLSVHLR